MKCLILGAIFITTSCGYDVSKSPTAPASSPTNSKVESGAAGGVTFSQIQTAILQPSCTHCHGSGGAAGVDVSTYASTMEIVSPGAPERSLLFTVIDSGEMPKRAPKLSGEKIQLLKSWILAGAKQN